MYILTNTGYTMLKFVSVIDCEQLSESGGTTVICTTSRPLVETPACLLRKLPDDGLHLIPVNCKRINTCS